MPGGVEPSNLDKVFWPEKGLTKGDLIAYFQRVAACIVPAIRDRPLSLPLHRKLNLYIRVTIADHPIG